LAEKNLLKAKQFVKQLLLDELKDAHIRSKNVSPEVALIRSDKALCLVKLVDVNDSLDSLFPELAKKILWNKYVVLEKDYFQIYLEQFELLKKEQPIKGSVIFVTRTGETYMVSPYALVEFQETYHMFCKSENSSLLYFPTIFLNSANLPERPIDEIQAQQRISIISQINELEESEEWIDQEDWELDGEDDSLYSTFFSNRPFAEYPKEFSPRFSGLEETDTRELMMNLLFEMTKNLKEINQEMKKINKWFKKK